MSNNTQAVIYCRVSSRAQEEEGHGLQSQENRCREFAASKGYDVAAVFPDTISGGGDFMKRPGMVALLSFLDAQPDQGFVVIFDDLKRFARDTRFHLDLREAFRKRGAQIECLNFKFDDTPEGEFIETIMAAQGALERKQNGRQVAQKMRARMQNGYWVHNAPVGYCYKTVKGHGKLLIRDEPLASIVTEAIEGYALGRFQTQAEVLRFLEGFPEFPRCPSGFIRSKRITDILAQPLYAGYICSDVYGLNWRKGQHEPLISMETYDLVQERRDGLARAPARKNLGDDFALRGFACCASCGKQLRSSWSKGKTKYYPYYLCQTKGCDAYGKSIPRDKIEGDFARVLKELQPTPAVFKLATQMFQDAWNARLAQAKAAAGNASKKIAAADKQIEALLERIMSATNDTVINAYEGKIAKLEKDKAKAAEASAAKLPPKGRFEETLELALRFLASPCKIWESGDQTLRRTMLRLAFAERFEYCRIEGARTPQLSLPFKALRGVYTIENQNGAAGED